MSCPTQNTVVVKVEDIEILLKALEENDNVYGWIHEIHNIYQDDNVSIFTFDCNGQPLAVDEMVNYLVLETNYLDGEPMYTQVYDSKKKRYKDSRYHAKYWIKKLIGEENLSSIIHALRYSDGRL